MKFTLERALIFILVISLVYYVVKHRNLVKDVLSIPDRDHPELKKVIEKHHIKSKNIYCPHTKVPGKGKNGQWQIPYDESVDPQVSKQDRKWYTLNWRSNGDDCKNLHFHDVVLSTDHLESEKAIKLLDKACKTTCEKHSWILSNDRICELDPESIQYLDSADNNGVEKFVDSASCRTNDRESGECDFGKGCDDQ
jgi:hypothetical protein